MKRTSYLKSRQNCVRTNCDWRTRFRKKKKKSRVSRAPKMWSRQSISRRLSRLRMRKRRFLGTRLRKLSGTARRKKRRII